MSGPGGREGAAGRGSSPPVGADRREVRRRALHVAAGVLGPLAAALGAPLASPAFAVLLLLAAAAELARHRWPAARAALELAAGGAFRPQEASGISGASTLALGFALSWWLFPSGAAERGILVAALADPVAATVGSRFGGGRRKSWPGSLACAATAALVLAVTGVAPGPAILIGVAAAVAELAPWRGVDNVAVPVAVAALLWRLP